MRHNQQAYNHSLFSMSITSRSIKAQNRWEGTKPSSHPPLHAHGHLSSNRSCRERNHTDSICPESLAWPRAGAQYLLLLLPETESREQHKVCSTSQSLFPCHLQLLRGREQPMNDSAHCWLALHTEMKTGSKTTGINYSNPATCTRREGGREGGKK